MDKQSPEKTGPLSLKERADISIQKAREIILEHIPNDEIISIYVKGSYIQGELNSESDVDIVVVLRTDKYLPAVYELTDKFGNTTYPPISVSGYTMGELTTGEKAANRPKSKTPVSAFVKHMDFFPLIYGSKPEGKLFTRTDVKDLTAFMSNFKKSFLPDYETGKFHLASLVKSVIWLVEKEERAKGKNPEYSWKKLDESIKDPEHIIHMAFEFRKREGEITEEERKVFIDKLLKYLDFLETQYKK